MSNRLSVLVFAILASVVLLGACGKGGGSTSTDPESTKDAPPEIVSPRSAPFQKYSNGGPVPLHIAEFGVEGSSKEREEVSPIVVAYLQAIGSGDWANACRYLSGSMLSRIETISQSLTKIRQPTCAFILRALVRSSNRKTGESLVYASHGIASLRIKKGPRAGFALFHGSDGNDYWVTVKHEDERWGVSSFTPEKFLYPSRKK
jgi:hypothetical protein